MNSALEAYCEKKGIKYEKSKVVRQPNTGTAIRCKVFIGEKTQEENDFFTPEEDGLPF